MTAVSSEPQPDQGAASRYDASDYLPGSLKEDFPGKLIVLEGPDGSGRSSHIKLLGEWLEWQGFAVQTMGLKRSKLLGEDLNSLGKNNELPSTTVSHANFNSFTAQLLTERQYRVEVYAENKGKNSWSIVRQGSPGNLESFEDVVFDHGGDTQDTPTACCVQVSQGDAGWKVGLAYCDNTLKVIGMVEFLDGDQLCNLEAALVRLGARECVALEDKAGGNKSVDNRKVREVLLRCDVVLTPRKASDFSTKDIDQVAFLLLLTLLTDCCILRGLRIPFFL